MSKCTGVVCAFSVEYNEAMSLNPENPDAPSQIPWTERPFASNHIYLYAEIDGQSVPAAVISYQLVQNPDAPEDYCEGLQDALENCLKNLLILDKIPLEANKIV